MLKSGFEGPSSNNVVRLLQHEVVQIRLLCFDLQSIWNHKAANLPASSAFSVVARIFPYAFDDAFDVGLISQAHVFAR